MPRAGVKQTQAQRARNKENNFALAGELKSAAMEYEDKMGEIADSYGRSIKAVYSLSRLSNPAGKQRRTVNAWNAFLAHKAEQVFQDDTVGKVKIRTFIANNKELLQKEYNELSSETRKALVDKLTAAKDDKLGKVRLSKQSIQKDFDHAFKNIHLDTQATQRRSQAEAFSIAVKTNPLHHQAPAVHAGRVVEGWLRQVYHTTPAEMALSLECYASTGIVQGDDLRKRASFTDDLKYVRRQIQLTLDTLLRSIGKLAVSKKSVQMNYKNYEKDIVEKFGVALVGMPEGIEVTQPNTYNQSQLSNLAQALEASTCKWDPLDKGQLTARISSNRARQANGEKIYKARKPRAPKQAAAVAAV
ncbi:hypothetical protein OF83DRAFT_1179657 [Amylostereum chailletii]|nr:hypothetical protein OF83DRAFT_1179657 [Amylostereum chailletii]